jgi:hypothetical protein
VSQLLVWLRISAIYVALHAAAAVKLRPTWRCSTVAIWEEVFGFGYQKFRTLYQYQSRTWRSIAADYINHHVDLSNIVNLRGSRARWVYYHSPLTSNWNARVQQHSVEPCSNGGIEFNSLSSSDKILEIGRDLTKLSPKFGSSLFWDTVYMWLALSLIQLYLQRLHCESVTPAAVVIFQCGIIFTQTTCSVQSKLASYVMKFPVDFMLKSFDRILLKKRVVWFFLTFGQTIVLDVCYGCVGLRSLKN